MTPTHHDGLMGCWQAFSALDSLGGAWWDAGMNGPAFYVNLEGAVQGPVSLEELQSWRERSRVKGDTPVRFTTDNRWMICDMVLPGYALLDAFEGRVRARNGGRMIMLPVETIKGWAEMARRAHQAGLGSAEQQRLLGELKREVTFYETAKINWAHGVKLMEWTLAPQRERERSPPKRGWHPLLRWLAIVPAMGAVLAGVMLLCIITQLVFNISTRMVLIWPFGKPAEDDFSLMVLLCAGMGGFGMVYVAHELAPAGKRVVAVLACCIVVVFFAWSLSARWRYGGSPYWGYLVDVAWLCGACAACWQAVRGTLNEADVTPR